MPELTDNELRAEIRKYQATAGSLDQCVWDLAVASRHTISAYTVKHFMDGRGLRRAQRDSLINALELAPHLDQAVARLQAEIAAAKLESLKSKAR